jgi:hypothetical protein
VHIFRLGYRHNYLVGVEEKFIAGFINVDKRFAGYS